MGRPCLSSSKSRNRCGQLKEHGRTGRVRIGCQGMVDGSLKVYRNASVCSHRAVGVDSMTLDARSRSGFEAQSYFWHRWNMTTAQIEDRGRDSRSFYCSRSYFCEKEGSQHGRFSPFSAILVSSSTSISFFRFCHVFSGLMHD